MICLNFDEIPHMITRLGLIFRFDYAHYIRHTREGGYPEVLLRFLDSRLRESDDFLGCMINPTSLPDSFKF